MAARGQTLFSKFRPHVFIFLQNKLCSVANLVFKVELCF